MSKTVEERIVSMQFDNKQFERNVSTTMSTLDKLKKSLKLEDSVKGFDKINDAAKKFDVTPLSNGVESVKAKFSALEVMGMTCLANITNSAFEAGKKLVSAFTIDPIKSGFQEYETQINAVQTILANTSHNGTTLDQVNNALDTLNTYADKTIYNFTEMTRNIGTFTAAGLDLDTSVKGIQGIANLAAVSGSTSQQASTAMYQLSQALSAGTVQLMDWNSVVNAGMGGKVFQDAIIQTGKEMGALDASIVQAYEDGASFRSLLDGTSGHGKWFTSDILSTTLSKFTKTGVVEYMAEFAGVTKEEMQALQDLGDQTNYNSEEFDKMALSLANGDAEFAENIKSTLKMATTAEDAATKVKTFSQLMDTLKEAVQSGWTQTWEILVGDFEEAKSVFTSISDVIGDVINKSAESRNNILEGAFGSKWGQFSKIIEDTGIPLDAFKEKLTDTARENGVAIDELVQKYGSLEAVINKGKISSDIFKKAIMSFTGASNESVKATEDMSGKLEEFQKVVDDVWGGSYKNGEERIKALTDAGYDYNKVQNLVNKTVDGHRLTLADLGEEQLANIGCTEDQINLYKELEKQAEATGVPLDALLEQMSRPTGRELLIESFSNAFKGLKKIIKPVADAYNEIFNPKSDAEKAEGLYGIIRAINEFSKKLIITDGTAKKVERTFKGVFAILDLLRMVVGGGLSIAFKVLNTVLGMFNMNIWDVTAVIGDAAVAVRDFIKEHDVLTAAIEFIVPLIVKAATAIADWAANSETLQNAISGVTGFLGDAKDAISEWINSFDDAESIPEHIISGLKNGITNGLPDLASAALEIGRAILDAVKDFLGIHSPSKEFESVGEFSIEGLIKGIQNKLSDLKESAGDIGGTLMDVFSDIDFGKIFSVLLSGGLIAAMIKMAKAFEAFSKPAEGIGDVLSGTGDVLSGFGKVLSESAKSISKVIKSFSKVLKGFSKVLKGLAFDLKAKAFLKIAIALAILVAAVALLTLVDQDKLKSAAGTIVVLAGVLAVLAAVLSKMSGNLVAIDKNGVKISDVVPKIVAIGVALLLIAAAIKVIGSMKPDQFKQGMLGLAGVIAGFAVIIGTFGLLCKGKNSKNISKVGGMMLKLSLAMLLMIGVIKLISMLSPTEIVKGIVAMAFFTIFVGALMEVVGKNGKHADKVGSFMLKLSVALIIMTGVVKILGEMDPWALLRGMGSIVLLAVIISVLTNSVAKHQGEMPKIAGCLLALSSALVIMSIAVKILGSIDLGSLAKGIGAITILAVIISKLIDSVAKHLGTMPKIATTLIALSLAIAILAGVSMILGLMSIPALLKGVTAVTILGVVMALMINATKNAYNCKGNIIAMTVAISLMAVAVAALSFLDPTKLGYSTLCMTILMGIFALVIKTAGDAQGSLPVLGIMTVVVGLIGVVLYSLAQLPWENTIAASAGVSLVLLAFASAMAIISNCKSISPTTIATLALMVLIVGALAILISTLANIDASGAMDIVLPLALLAGTLAILAVGVNAMTGAIAGAAALLVVSAALVVLVPVIKSLEGLSFEKVGQGLLVLAAALLGLVGIGYLATYAAGGLLAIGVAVALIGAGSLAAGVGVLKLSKGLKELSKSGKAGMKVLNDILIQVIALIPTLAIAIGQGIVNLIIVLGQSALTIGATIVQVVSTILTMLTTLIPQFVAFVVTVGTAILNAAMQLAPLYIECVLTILDSLLSSLAEHTPSIVQSIVEIAYGIVEGFLNGVAEKIPDVINAGFNLIISFINGLADSVVANAPLLRDAMGNLATSMLTAICEFLGINSPSTKFAEIGQFIIEGLIQGIGDFVGGVIDKVKEVAGNMLDAAKEKLKNFKDKGKEAMNKLKDGIGEKIDSVKNKAKSVCTKAVEGIKEKIEKFKSAGKDLMDGLKKGITEKKDAIIEKLKDIVDDAIEAAKEALGIHSPSRVFAEIGRFTDEGFVIGLEKYAGKVEDASAGVGQKAVDGISNAISNIGEISDIDVAPSIRPVLDMDGVNYRNLQLNADLSTVMTKPVNSLGNLMTETQNAINASNNRVISAINGLRDEFSEFANMDDTEIGFYVDGKKLASSLARPMNRELNVLARRGGI